MLRPSQVLLVAALVVGTSPTAAAPTPTEDVNATALFKEGVAQRDAGHREQALDAFLKSHVLAVSPRPGLEAARLLVARGDLLEAEQVLREVIKMPPYKESAKTKLAREQASTLAREIEPRIAKLRIHVKGPRDTVLVFLDDAEFKPALLDTLWRVNPRTHVVELRADGRVVARKEVAVADGATVDVELEAPAQPASTPVAASGDSALGSAETSSSRSQSPGAQASNARPVTSPPPASTPATGSTWRTVGYVMGGVGVVGLGVGAAFGLLAAAKASSAKEFCRTDTTCDSYEGKSIRDQGIVFGDVSTALFIGGGALLTGGLVLVLTSPSSKSHQPHGVSSVTWTISANQIELRGRF